MLLWYGTFLVAGLLVHGALRNADSVVLPAALLAGAVALPLTMLGYTIRSNGGDFNSHVLVPAIGPIVIAVLIFDYVEYNRRIDEAFSAQLISTDLVGLSDVKWTGVGAGKSGHLSGRVSNRSPHQLIDLSLEVRLYAGSEKVASVIADADLDVPPGQQRGFNLTTTARPAGPADALPCSDERAAPAQGIRGGAQEFSCIYRLKGVHGEEVAF
ncbi:MAG: hypothetical protein ACLQU2_22025 [Candidatus Binataceae bacterium]